MNKKLLYRDLPLDAKFTVEGVSSEFYQRIDHIHCYVYPDPKLGVNAGLRTLQHIDPEIEVKIMDIEIKKQ